MSDTKEVKKPGVFLAIMVGVWILSAIASVVAIFIAVGPQGLYLHAHLLLFILNVIVVTLGIVVLVGVVLWKRWALYGAIVFVLLHLLFEFIFLSAFISLIEGVGIILVDMLVIWALLRKQSLFLEPTYHSESTKKARNIFWIITLGTIVIVICGVGYAAYKSISSHPVISSNVSPITFLVDDQPFSGIPASSSDWAMLIPMKSLSSTIEMTKEDWMAAPATYETNIITAEEQAASSTISTQVYWMSILSDKSKLQSIISQLNTEINTENEQAQYMSQMQTLFTDLLADHNQVIFGTAGKKATPEQLQNLQPLWSSLIMLTQDCEYLLNKEAAVQQAEITALNTDNVTAIINAESDEATLSPLYTWFYDAYTAANNQELLLKQQYSLPS